MHYIELVILDRFNKASQEKDNILDNTYVRISFRMI